MESYCKDCQTADICPDSRRLLLPQTLSLKLVVIVTDRDEFIFQVRI